METISLNNIKRPVRWIDGLPSKTNPFPLFCPIFKYRSGSLYNNSSSSTFLQLMFAINVNIMWDKKVSFKQILQSQSGKLQLSVLIVRCLDCSHKKENSILVQNLLPLSRLSVVMCFILTCFWCSGRPVSATSTPRVKFTNRRKEKPLPALNVVMRPRRLKTSACPVSCTHGSEPLSQLKGCLVEIVGGSDYLPKYFLHHNGIVNRPI